MTSPTPTMAQTVVLLALSRGKQPPYLAPATRQNLVRAKWIVATGPAPAPAEKRHAKAPRRPYVITDAGRRALATSPHIEAAQRTLDQTRKP
jgi:hypothetical protein